MPKETLHLSLALSDNPNTRPLLNGQVEAQGVSLTATAVHPSEMFWRQLKFAEFDVSEMSMSSLLIATSRGPTPWVAIPVFTTREFFHTRMLVRTDAGIDSPADLRGKRVGVPEFQQTAAIWGRGALQHEWGVKTSEVEWFMERLAERSHGGATGSTAPAGVTIRQIPPETNIGEMLVKGELDAALLYLTNPNLVDRSRLDLSKHPRVRPMFADREAEGRRYYAKTGLYPINHTVVVRRSLAEQHPWLPLNLYAAFVKAKEMVMQRGNEYLANYFTTGLLGDEVKRQLGKDPMTYGVTASRTVLETIAQYQYEQGLTQRRVGLEELFAPSTMDL